MKNKKSIIIPAQTVELSHLPDSAPITVHAGENTLVVVPEHMTAMEAVNTIDALSDIIAELLAAFMDACGTCEEQKESGNGCIFGESCGPDQCPYDGMDGPQVELSSATRKKAGIAPDAKLDYIVDDGEVLVMEAEYQHDITDVPDHIRELFKMAGVCPGQLNELLMDEEEVWHG